MGLSTKSYARRLCPQLAVLASKCKFEDVAELLQSSRGASVLENAELLGVRTHRAYQGPQLA